MTTTGQTLSAVDVRDRLTTALRMDLIGPLPGEPEATEVLPEPPPKWYLMGYLVPAETSFEDRATDDGQDQLGELHGGGPKPEHRGRRSDRRSVFCSGA